jgi:hypothetical protein
VHTAQSSGGLEGGKVAADGFGGDPETLGEIGDAGAAAGCHKPGDLLLTLLSEHIPSIA